MASINAIVYILGTKGIPMTITDICNELKEEVDRKHRYNRVWSFMKNFSTFFNKNKKNKEVKYTLSQAGKYKFEKIELIYDPITDTLLE